MKNKMAKRLLALILCAGLLLNRDMFALATVSSGDAGEVTSVDGDNTVTPGDADKTQIDIETAEDWEATLPALTGEYGVDVAAIAVSQLGYSQSKENTQADEAGIVTGYYSRYGAWNGTPYAEWATLFVKFCVSYAKVPADRFPVVDTAAEWMSALNAEDCGMFVAASVSADEYTPFVGDLLFLDMNGDGTADRVAVIVEVADDGTIKTVEEVEGVVANVSYVAGDAKILGYGMMPFDMEGIEASTLEVKGSTGHQPDTTIKVPNIIYDKGQQDPVEDSEALELNKTINAGTDENENTFVLTLDAFATGETTEITTVSPMDITLVLDRSGSMVQARQMLTVKAEDGLEEGCTYYDYHGTWDSSDPRLPKFLDKNGNETPKYNGYYADKWGQSTGKPNPITYCECNSCYDEVTGEGKWVKKLSTYTDPTTGEQLYEVLGTTAEVEEKLKSGAITWYETNMQATERALKVYLATLKAQSVAYGVEHRVAICSYADKSSTMYAKKTTYALNDDKYYNPGNAYMGVISEWDQIVDAISKYAKLSFSGASTPTHKGMEAAENIYSKVWKNGPIGKPMIVVFADGAPGVSTNYYEEWANKALQWAEKIKSHEENVPIYVVGLYDAAGKLDVDGLISFLGDSSIEKYYQSSDRFFEYLSSNFIVGLQVSNGYYDGTTGADAVISASKKENANYFHPTSSPGALANAFAQIAVSKDSTVTTSVNLDERTVLRDQISTYFEHDCTCEATDASSHTCIEVYTVGWDGSAFDGESEWKKVYPGVSEDTEIATGTINVTIKDKSIDVTGFSYKDFPVVEGQSGGKKIVVKVPIETEEGFWGGNNVPTNDAPTNKDDSTGSAIYSDGKVIEAFPQPEANVPLSLDIVAQDKTIYYGGAILPSDLLTGITAGYKTVGTTEPKGAVTVNEDGTLAPAEEWMDDYASITWNTYADKTMASGTKLPTGAVSNKEYGDYLYKVTVAPKAAAQNNTSGHPGVNEAGGAIAGTAVSTSGFSKEDTGYAYILVPKVEFRDSLIKLGYIPKETDYETDNRVTQDAAVQWVEMGSGTYSPESAADNDPATYPPVDEATKPTLTYEYTPKDSAFSADTPVNVAVISDKLDGQSGEITDITTFLWEDCKSSSIAGYHDEAVITTHKGDADSYEFWIHVRPTEVTVNKVWVDGGWYGDTYADRPTSIDVVLKRDGEVYKEATLKVADGWTYTWSNLPICDADGKVYTYTVDEPTVPGGYEKSISGTTITNTLVKTEVPVEKQWTNEEGVTGSRPDSILVRLEKLEDGSWEQVTNGATILADVSLDDSNNWKHTFTQLPKKDASNNDITYRIREVKQESNSMAAVTDGELISGKNGWYYKVKYSNSNNNWIITNELQKTQLTLTKRINAKDAENATAIFRYLITGSNNYSANVTVNFEAGTVSGLETGTVKVNGTVMVTDNNVADNIGFDKDGLSVTISNLQPGTYKVIEYAARGYELVQQATTDQKAPEENVTAFSGVQKPLDVEATVAEPGKAYYWNRYNVPTDYTAVNRFSVDANGNLSISVDRKNN